jgi:hypothetical protein
LSRTTRGRAARRAWLRGPGLAAQGAPGHRDDEWPGRPAVGGRPGRPAEADRRLPRPKGGHRVHRNRADEPGRS